MKVSTFSIAVVLLSAFACLQACVARPADDKLDEKIPKADKKKYESIRDGKDWANPYLGKAEGTVYADLWRSPLYG
jgi:hypothetical protein